MISISRSLGRKLAATATVAIGLVLMYESKVIDFRDIALPIETADAASVDELAPAAGIQHLRFTATAYCKGTTTASGVNVRTGIAAADPELLPVGSVIQVYRLGERYNGIYTIMDTGPSVQGRHVDIYMWSCNEALQFGRRPIHLTVLRHGWSPRNTTPTFVERVFRRSGPQPLAARPLPQDAASAEQ